MELVVTYAQWVSQDIEEQEWDEAYMNLCLLQEEVEKLRKFIESQES